MLVYQQMAAMYKSVLRSLWSHLENIHIVSEVLEFLHTLLDNMLDFGLGHHQHFLKNI